MALIDKCVHYWKLDEESDGTGAVSRADSHSGNTLTDYNTTASTAGKLGSAANFVAAENTYLEMATPYDPGTSDFSLSFWANFYTVGLQHIIATGGYASGADGFTVYIFNGTLYLGIVDSVNSTVTTVTLATGLTSGQWYHIVVTCDRDGNATCWISGVEALSGSIAGQQASLGATIGRLGIATNLARDMNGLLDEFGIFNVVLTPEEIATLYGGGTPAAYPWPTVKTHFALSGGTVKVLFTQ